MDSDGTGRFCSGGRDTDRDGDVDPTSRFLDPDSFSIRISHYDAHGGYPGLKSMGAVCMPNESHCGLSRRRLGRHGEKARETGPTGGTDRILRVDQWAGHRDDQ